MLLGAGVLHLIPRLGGAGRRIADALCRAPGLDAVITYFTIAPLIVGAVLFGWIGLPAAVAGQVLGMKLWEWAHEFVHRDARRGPRIVKVINGKVGYLRNALATWTTAFATPLFWFTRLAELLVYPPLTWLVGLPKYQTREWVNVSRQKFTGLIGHDLVWCLYCDWMTGVWSLATEMLRNVESFWCPIRFCSDEKCEHCKTDFPDVATDWIPADGTMADVTALLAAGYPTGPTAPKPWFGHPARLTLRGKPIEQPPGEQRASD